MANDYEPTTQGLADVLPGEDIAQAQEDHERRARSERRSLRPIFKPMAQKRWHLDEPKPRPPLICIPRADQDPSPWLLRGKVAMLVAPGGTGKSQALIQLAMCIASENPKRRWLGWFEIPADARGPVVLALGEEGEDDLHARIWGTLEAWGCSRDERETIARNLYPLGMASKSTAMMAQPVPVWRVEETLAQLVAVEPGRYSDDQIDRVRQRLLEGWTGQHDEWHDLLTDPPAPLEQTNRGQWRAIIMDPASQFIGPDVETDNAAATRFVQMLQTWAVKRWSGADIGPTVLFAHHTSKSAVRDGPEAFLANSGASRGSSALTDGVRWQANMVAVAGAEQRFTGQVVDHELVMMQVSKSNDGIKGGTIYLDRDMTNGVLRWIPSGDGERMRAERQRLDEKTDQDERPAPGSRGKRSAGDDSGWGYNRDE